MVYVGSSQVDPEHYKHDTIIS